MRGPQATIWPAGSCRAICSGSLPGLLPSVRGRWARIVAAAKSSMIGAGSGPGHGRAAAPERCASATVPVSGQIGGSMVDGMAFSDIRFPRFRYPVQDRPVIVSVQIPEVAPVTGAVPKKDLALDQAATAVTALAISAISSRSAARCSGTARFGGQLGGLTENGIGIWPRCTAHLRHLGRDASRARPRCAGSPLLHVDDILSGCGRAPGREGRPSGL